MSVTTTDPTKRRRLYFAGGVGLFILLGFYTVTDPARLHGHLPFQAADVAGYAICHRITERSFSIAGRQLPLCARCTGMYLGFALTMLWLALAGRWRRSLLPPRRVLAVLVLLVVLMGIDGVNSYSHFFPGAPHLYEPRNWLRLMTGLGTGVAMGAVLWPMVAETVWRKRERQPAVASLAELGGVLLVTAVAGLLVLSNEPTLLYVLALVSAAGVVAVVTLLNMVMGLLIVRRDGRAERWSHSVLPLALGLVLAAGQLGLVAYVRFALTGTMTGLPGL